MGDTSPQVNGVATQASHETDPSRRRGPTDEDRAKGQAVVQEKFAARIALAEEMFSRTPDIDPRIVNDAVRARLGHGLGCANLYRIKRYVRSRLGLDPRAKPTPSPYDLSQSAVAVRARRWRAARRAAREGLPAAGRRVVPVAGPGELPAGIRAAAELIASEAAAALWEGSVTIQCAMGGASSIAWSHEVRRVESGRVTLPRSAP